MHGGREYQAANLKDGNRYRSEQKLFLHSQVFLNQVGTKKTTAFGHKSTEMKSVRPDAVQDPGRPTAASTHRFFVEKNDATCTQHLQNNGKRIIICLVLSGE